jgi:hypothetical protein
VPEIERYLTRWDGDLLVVERDTAGGRRPAELPVRIRGV